MNRRIPTTLLAAVTAGTAVRLVLAFTTRGTQDVSTWLSFRDSIVRSGIAETYVAMPHFNHPPLMGLYLWFTYLAGDIVPFAAAIRLPAILADIGTAMLVFGLMQRFAPESHAVWSAVIVALSPVLIPISGFHGNTDPVFVFLILLSARQLTVRNDAAVSGLWFGLALNVKIVPILVLPVLFFWISDWRDRARFACGAAVVVAAGYAWTAVRVPSALVDNMLYYWSYPGFWGLSLLGRWAGIWSDRMTAAMKWGLVSAIVVSAPFLAGSHGGEGKERPARLLRAIGVVYAMFIGLTPGFGPQYLSWLTFTVFMGLRGFTALTFLAGAYIIAVYTYWCGGIPWDYADPTRDSALLPYLHAASLVPWAFLAGWTCAVLSRGSGTGRPGLRAGGAEPASAAAVLKKRPT